ncbi:hypothetical protein [Helicobacter ganmani]|uniref:hypothetical protein n=1 Tax=Helicobacter ganmani TaxID=60246 RepID=UPI003A83F4D9
MKFSCLTKKEKEVLSFDKKSQLLKDIEKIDKKLFNIATNLIDEIAFIFAELTDLREIIKKSGAVEFYQNGANQRGIKKSAAIDAYNTILKNYVTVCKQLASLISDVDIDADDDFEDFLKEK